MSRNTIPGLWFPKFAGCIAMCVSRYRDPVKGGSAPRRIEGAVVVTFDATCSAG